MGTHRRTRPATGGVFPYATPTHGYRRWAFDYVDRATGRRRRAAGFRTKAVALAEQQRLERIAEGLSPADGPGLVFKDLVTEFLDAYRTRSGSMTYYAQRADVWLRYFGDWEVSEIRMRDVERFRNERLKEVSASTVRKDLTALATLFRWAQPRGFAIINPANASAVRRPSPPPAQPNPLTDREIDALLAALPVTHRAIVRFCLATGCDRGEAVQLAWEQIDTDRKVIWMVRGKTGVERPIPYAQNREVATLLEEAGRIRHRSGRVFLGADGEPTTVNAAKIAMTRAWPRAVPGKTRPWKSLRATFVNILDEQGASEGEIADLIGVSTGHVLRHYLRRRARRLEPVVRAIPVRG